MFNIAHWDVKESTVFRKERCCEHFL